MEKRYIAFLVLAVGLVLANAWIIQWMNPPRPRPAPAAQGPKDAADKQGDKAAEAKAAGQKGAADKADADKAGAEVKAAVAPQPGPPPRGEGGDKQAEVPLKPKKPAPVAVAPQRQWGTLGSADPDSPYRLLVTWDNQAAAIQRIETNSPNLTDQENRSGYLGHLNAKTAPQGGALVNVVGEGTPAAQAGLLSPRYDESGKLIASDVIVRFAGQDIATNDDLDKALALSRPGQQVEIVVDRTAQNGGGGRETLTATLTREPMQVVRPEGADPLSFLMTLESLGKETIAKGADELKDVHMRTATWRVVQDKNKPEEVTFEYDLWRDRPDERLVIRKTLRLDKVDPADHANPTAAAYDLQLHVAVENQGEEPREVAYRLDGPTGLPIEGAWFASKVSPNGVIIPSAVGLRDIAVNTISGGVESPRLISSYSILEGEEKDKPVEILDQPLVYVGVDAQYFACVLIPQLANPDKVHFTQIIPIRVGPVPDVKAKRNRTNFTCRLVSAPVTLAAGGRLDDPFEVFAGPKKPDLLELYGLSNLLYYGWFGWVSRPMLHILHFFYTIVPNYGVAIVMLTVLVRLCMFPLSRKQALGAQKMQELQPEMKRIAEKYKGNLEARSKAQQELFAKHNYHPLSGCLPAFIQLPIFMGLYRSLAVNVELRGAPLFGQSIRWCSNLAAPDMLWKWQDYLPAFIAGETGWLGPYFNLLPCITIALFIWQQKKFMPPPTDEQAAMQQKIMRYMMIVMGVMFFKVPSGLCLYFIASSTWSMAERKLLPKVVRPQAGQEPPPAPPKKKALPLKPSPSGNGATGGKKSKHGGRK